MLTTKKTSPILLIAWRRPHTLRQVIEAIRPVAPTRLFVACDGPNPERPGEADKVGATRAVIDSEIDWPCKIERLYSDVNQGCRLGVSRAITWFFQQVDEGIILEDDCVPHPDFFTYCTSLLERYRHDTRVWCISGNNFQNGQWRGDGSYYFSRYPHCWGWASWSTRWDSYSHMIEKWPLLKSSGLLESIFEYESERSFRSEKIDSIRDGRLDSWAFLWAMTCMANNGLSALPNVNLVKNIGFGEDATHTVSGGTNRACSVSCLGSMLHPSFVIRDKAADTYTFQVLFGGNVKAGSKMRLCRSVYSFASILRLSIYKIYRILMSKMKA